VALLKPGRRYICDAQLREAVFGKIEVLWMISPGGRFGVNAFMEKSIEDMHAFGAFDLEEMSHATKQLICTSGAPAVPLKEYLGDTRPKCVLTGLQI
jgi:hypothetical protein